MLIYLLFHNGSLLKNIAVTKANHLSDYRQTVVFYKGTLIA